MKPEWDVWVHGKSPLVSSFIPEKELSLFQCSAMLGRHLLMAKTEAALLGTTFWVARGIDEHFLVQFRKKLWKIEQAR